MTYVNGVLRVNGKNEDAYDDIELRRVKIV